ncbi:helix-turn-helix domain-containing protein [Primorskyibacter aestuariivivens]|uniref:helix-turn-helix domain-containing protein n=1 Tax=Primorskyibacter aestuariivivens TaxID=1888912 RepID=UPI00230164E0|nr:helix-turn-helix domain-containing protein [Primorskyibacter aestuariivivens]MDA7427900.1 helix-turn-helix domain-containing protein [Primorskyibacter aestuariivivens]
MTAREVTYPKPPAQVQPYVDVLGPALALDPLLTFGGSVVYIPDAPGDRSELVALIGYDKARELARQKHRLQNRVPLAKPWVIAGLRARGYSINKIARTLYMSDVSVRAILKRSRRTTER